MVQNSFQLQKRLKNYSKNWIFSKFSNDPKNVYRHCGVHYNIKNKHFKDFSGGGSSSPPHVKCTKKSLCQIGLNSNQNVMELKSYLFLSARTVQQRFALIFTECLCHKNRRKLEDLKKARTLLKILLNNLQFFWFPKFRIVFTPQDTPPMV